jgi:hypothetical protein
LYNRPKIMAALLKEQGDVLKKRGYAYGSWNVLKLDGPMQYAVTNGNAEIVEVLLQHAASEDARLCYGAYFLQRAAELGNEKVVAVLLEYGAMPDFKVHGTLKSALSLAVSNGHSEVVRLILDKKEELNTLDKGKLGKYIKRAQRMAKNCKDLEKKTKYENILQHLTDKYNGLIAPRDGVGLMRWASAKLSSKFRGNGSGVGMGEGPDAPSTPSGKGRKRTNSGG